MLNELNEFVGNYKNLVDAINVIFPFLLTMIMAMIAYEQYKINLHLEYNRFLNEVDNNLKDEVEKIIEQIIKIISSDQKDINKQEQILNEMSKFEQICVKYEHILEYSDSQLLKESYSDLKKWVKDTKNYKWTFKEFTNSFNIITTFLSFLWYADSCYLKQPNKNMTLYSLIGFFFYRIYSFFVPYFLQKKIKKFIYPKLFKLKTIFFSLSLIIKLINLLREKKDDKNNTTTEKLIEKM